MKKLLLSSLLLTIVCLHTAWAQLYVNPSTGNDANNGTSVATAKQSLRGALRVLPGPNTTIYIVGGDYPYSTMTNNANRSLGFGPGQSVTSGITNANLPGTVIEGMGCVYWHNSNDDGTGAQNPIMTVEAVNGFTVRNINFLGWQGTNASMMFINCNNVRIENCTFHQSALNSATALRFDGDATETTIAANTTQNYFVDGCTFQNNGNPSGQGTGQALYIRNNGASVGTGTFNVDIRNSKFVCNFAATGGALYSQAVNNADKHPNVTISGCSFSGNTASSQGGAIFSKYSNFNISGTSFCNNNAGGALSDRDGGAIHTDQGSNLIVSDCAFADNVAGRYGSAISVASNSLVTTISNSTFISNNIGNSTNSVVRTGGGTTTIDNCLFKDNATNALLGTITTINSSFIGNPGTAVSGTNVYDSQTASGVWADAFGHYFQPNGTQVGFTGAYATIDACPACPTKPIAGACKANAGVSLATNSTCFYICSDTTTGADVSNSGSMNITNVAGWTKPCDLSSAYHYYFLVVDASGNIVKVIDGDADSDGIPNFAENPTVNTNVDLSGIAPPGDYKVVGFYTNGAAPTVGTSAATAASTGCSSITGGSIGFKVLTAVRIVLSGTCTSSLGVPAPAGQFYANIDSVYGGFADLNNTFFTPRSYTLTTNFGTGPYNYTGTPIKDILVTFVAGAQITAQATTYTPQPTLCTSCISQVFAKDHKGCFVLSGNVFNDVNALNATPINTVDGTPINNPSGTLLYANLLDGAGNVVATVPVNSSGAYTFDGIGAATYSVQISTVQGTVGSAMPATAIPSSWVYTGENLGATAGNDGQVGGILTNIVVSGNVSDANFGIQHRPEADTITDAPQLNPGGIIELTVNPTLFGGTDTNMASAGYIDSLIISAFPANVTTLTINSVSYTSATWPVGGVVVPTNATGEPTQPITFDPIDGISLVTINYYVYDNGGATSLLPGKVDLPILNLSISGNVFNDVNGLNGAPLNTVDGTSINSPSGTPLYANLLNTTGNVIATMPISATGTYLFGELTSGTYQVQVNTVSGTVGSAAPAVVLPTGWVNTGENLGATTGNDGGVNGLLPTIVLSTTNVINANFGIQELPIPDTTVLASQTNPGGTNSVPVASTLFGDFDLSGGIIDSLLLSTFPSNVTSITIDGTTYTSAIWPVGGVIVPTNTTGQPSVPISVDPVDGIVSVEILYQVIDSAGFPSAAIGSVTLPFSSPLEITLNYFNGSIQNQTDLLTWSTIKENGNAYFELMHSKDGVNYSLINTQDSKAINGNSNSVLNYSFINLDANREVNYYKLISVDFSGNKQNSNIVVLRRTNVNVGMEIFPNPAQKEINVQTYANNSSAVSIRIVNTKGQVVKQVNFEHKKGTNTTTIDISALAAGDYIINFVNGQKQNVTKSFIKLK